MPVDGLEPAAAVRHGVRVAAFVAAPFSQWPAVGSYEGGIRFSCEVNSFVGDVPFMSISEQLSVFEPQGR